MKVAFLDRDGTIIEDYSDDKWKYVTEPRFLQNSIETLKTIKSRGYEIIVITNQYLIGEGYISQEQYEDISRQFEIILKANNINLLAIYYCPHKRADNCNCCKPRNGMVIKAFNDYPQIDISKSFLVGDSIRDVELGISINIRTFGIKVNSEMKGFTKIQDISDVLNHI